MEQFQVTPKHHNTRLDIFLAEIKGISRKKSKQLIDAGRLFLRDKKIIIASWKVQQGDVIKIQDPGKTSLPRRKRYLKVYYEDTDLIVVEKPAGVACESSPQTLTSTLVEDLNDYLRRAHPDKPYPYLGLMHRLDRETSGLMIYTLSRQANRLAKDFRRHKIQRRYLALVEGALKKSEGRIDRHLRKDARAQGKKMMVFQAKDKKTSGRAITDYIVQQRFAKATLVEARLLTGRTHQVRVHFASIGHPVIGDELYGSQTKARRHMLHASYLEFQHPITDKKMKFRSPVPKDFQEVLARFQKF